MHYHLSTTERRNGASAHQHSTQAQASSGNYHQLSASGKSIHKPLCPSDPHRHAKV